MNGKPRLTATFLAGALAAGIGGASVSEALASTSTPTLSALATTLDADATAINLLDPSGASTLQSVATQLNATSAPSGTQLDTLATEVDGVAATLPASLSPTVGPSLQTVASDLQTIASATTATTTTLPGTTTGGGVIGTVTGTVNGTTTGSTSTGTTTGTTSGTGATSTGGSSGTTAGGLTAAQLAYFRYLVATIEKLQAQLKAAASHSGYTVVGKVRRAGAKLTATLTCTASRDRRCSSTVTASRAGHHVSKHVTLGGGATRQITLTLPSHARSGPITVTATTGRASTSKTLG
jgi:hypothetical protein